MDCEFKATLIDSQSVILKALCFNTDVGIPWFMIHATQHISAGRFPYATLFLQRRGTCKHETCRAKGLGRIGDIFLSRLRVVH